MRPSPPGVTFPSVITVALAINLEPLAHFIGSYTGTERKIQLPNLSRSQCHNHPSGPITCLHSLVPRLAVAKAHKDTVSYERDEDKGEVF
jgi:hypothetical protein